MSSLRRSACCTCGGPCLFPQRTTLAWYFYSFFPLTWRIWQVFSACIASLCKVYAQTHSFFLFYPYSSLPTLPPFRLGPFPVFRRHDFRDGAEINDDKLTERGLCQETPEHRRSGASTYEEQASDEGQTTSTNTKLHVPGWLWPLMYVSF